MTSGAPLHHPASHPQLPVRDRSGQDYCFNCLVEEHQARAYNLSAYMLGDWALAEDACQEALLSAYGTFNTFRGDNLPAWLMRIVANRCRDMLRARKSGPNQPLDSLVVEPEDPVTSHIASPESQALSGELRRTIHAGLETLQGDQRTALVLIDVQGFSYEEAAQAMDSSLGTVKSRLSRARAAMRDFLRAQGELIYHQGCVIRHRAMLRLNFRRHPSQETLSEYLDGRLDARASGKLEAHLSSCSACGRQLEELRTTVGLLRQVPVLTPRRSFILTEAPTTSGAVERAEGHARPHGPRPWPPPPPRWPSLPSSPPTFRAGSAAPHPPGMKPPQPSLPRRQRWKRHSPRQKRS